MVAFSGVTISGGITYADPPMFFMANLSLSNGRGVAVAPSGNIYIVGNISDYMLIAKYNNIGTIQWQRSLGAVSSAEEGWGIAIDPSENVYITGYSNNTVGQANNVIIAKYNTSGTIQWQKQLAGTGTKNDYGTSIVVDSSENVYVTTYSNAGSATFDFVTFKLNNFGNMSWQRSLGNSASTDFGIGIALDSSTNDVYVTGFSDNNSTFDIVLAKYNTTGTLQWQRTLGNNTGGSDTGNSVAVDSSGNVYVTGLINGIGILVAKYNSSGAIQWQRSLTGSATIFANGVAVDSSNNVYVTGYGNISGTDDIFTAKYDSNGNLQWQRKLATTGADQSYGIAVDSTGIMYNIGFTNVSSGAVLLTKLPGDGALTGTYSLGGYDYVYSISTLTPATSTLANNVGILNGATSTLTLSDIALTNATGTGTSTVITF
jgi:uncharacterized delta-60 repeat protein